MSGPVYDVNAGSTTPSRLVYGVANVSSDGTISASGGSTVSLSTATANPVSLSSATINQVALVTPSFDSAMDDTNDAVKVTPPASRRAVDAISATLQSDRLTVGESGALVELTPKFARIAVTSSGTVTLVAAVATAKIRVISLALVAGSTMPFYFCSSASGGNPIFGDSTAKLTFAANGGFVLPQANLGWMETTSTNLPLCVTSTAAPALSGGLTYVETT